MTNRPLALLSVSDKTGVVDFARALVEAGFDLLSSGGTAAALREAGFEPLEVSEWTGFPEILDGRVKTLHPVVHAAVLARRDDPDHVATLKSLGIRPIDLVAVDLYPFERVARRPGASLDEVIENIDIGGPTLLRAAAKNYRHVIVVSHPTQYEEVARALLSGDVPEALRARLAREAIHRTASYDSSVHGWMRRAAPFAPPSAEEPFPSDLTAFAVAESRGLRYGENPHQRAALLVSAFANGGLAGAERLSGKEPSYNNYLDADAALGLAAEFDEPAAVVVKHTNPCGAAVGKDGAAAVVAALAGDPVSAYGGILALNRPFDEAVAEVVRSEARFLECIVAPSFEQGAVEALKEGPKWGKSVRLLSVGAEGLEGARGPAFSVRSISGGFLVQDRDAAGRDEVFAVVVGQDPDEGTRTTVRLAWLAAKHTKSNAIVLARGGAIVGVGAGQTSRIDAVRMAVEKAGERSAGAVLASDAFFPFRDGVDEAARAGVKVVVQPGGSIRDREVEQACREEGLTLLRAERRHFRH